MSDSDCRQMIMDVECWNELPYDGDELPNDGGSAVKPSLSARLRSTIDTFLLALGAAFAAEHTTDETTLMYFYGWHAGH